MKISFNAAWKWVLKHKVIALLLACWIVYRTRSLWLWPIAHFSRWQALTGMGYARDDKKIFAIKVPGNLVLLSYRKTLTKNEVMNDLSTINDIYRSDFVSVNEIKWPHYLFHQEWLILRSAPKAWDHVPIVDHQPWRLYLGVSAEGTPVFYCPPERGHLMFSGASGSGKTNLARSIVDYFEKEGFQKVIIGTKLKDFIGYSDFFMYDKQPSVELMDALEKIDLEVKRRRQWMAENRVFDIEHTPFKPILIVVEESFYVLRAVKKANDEGDQRQMALHDKIQTHLRQNRDAGVCICLISQRATVDEVAAIPGFKNSVTVVSGRLESKEQSITLLGADLCFTDRNIQAGRGVMAMRSESGNIFLLKAPFRGHEKS